jgi:hypothetical protein
LMSIRCRRTDFMFFHSYHKTPIPKMLRFHSLWQLLSAQELIVGLSAYKKACLSRQLPRLRHRWALGKLKSHPRNQHYVHQDERCSWLILGMLHSLSCKH